MRFGSEKPWYKSVTRLCAVAIFFERYKPLFGKGERKDFLRARRANDVAILWPDRRWDSEHAVIAHREKDQQRHGDHRYNWMIQHPIQTWLKDTLDYVINSLAHSVPPNPVRAIYTKSSPTRKEKLYFANFSDFERGTGPDRAR